MGVLRRIPGFRSATRKKQIVIGLIHLLLIGSCLSVLACGGDEESDSASGATPTARVEATATPVLLATITANPEPTATPVRTPLATPSPVPTAVPAPKPSPTSMPTAVPSPTSSPSPAAATPSPITIPTAPPQSDFDPQQYLGQGDEYNCGDFEFQWQAQAVLDADSTDPNQLDRDEDGTACESLK